MKSGLRAAGLVLGLCIVGFLIHQVGWAPIANSFTLLGWGYIVVLVYPIIWMTFNSLGWSTVVKRRHPHVQFKTLWLIRTAGESFNALLPSGYVGGEPLKAKLLSRSMPLRDAAASVLMAKAAQSVALVLFVGFGLTVGGRGGTFSLLHHPLELGALIFLTGGIAIFVGLLGNRGFSRLAAVLHRLFPLAWLERALPRLANLDESLGVLYRQGRAAFFGSVLWHACGWMSGALELVVIFALLGTPIHWREGWFIGALAQLGSVVGLFAPAGVGLYEGGHYLAAQMLGLPPALGVSVALIRRMRELFWDAVGLAIFWRTPHYPH